MVTAASLAQSRRQKCQDQFQELVNRIGGNCELHIILSNSKHPVAHVQQLLAAYAANTLYRYLACCFVFIDFMHAQHASLALVPVALMVDFLHAASASKQEDRAVHRTLPNTSIKALRWLAKHLQWQALSACMQNALVTSYSKQVESYDKKEAVPLPLALTVAWELAICMQSTPLTTKLVLGAALLCTHASIRFGDAQRVKWGSIQLSTQGMHAVAYAAKTTKRGQPFACTWHGISGRDMHSSWLLHWLAALAQLPQALPRSPPRQRMYSRNDTFASLRVQRHVSSQVAQRSMARGGAAPVPEPPFQVSEDIPTCTCLRLLFSQAPGRSSRHGTRPCTLSENRHTLTRQSLLVSQSVSCLCRIQIQRPRPWNGMHSRLRTPTARPRSSRLRNRRTMTRCTHTSVADPGVACTCPLLTPCKHTCLHCPRWDRFPFASSKPVAAQDLALPRL